MRADLVMAVALLIGVAVEGRFHLDRLERARHWQATREAAAEVEVHVLGEIVDARGGATLAPGGRSLGARIRAARAELGRRAVPLAPSTGTHLVELSGERFLVVNAPESPPVVLWWPGLEARAERLSGAEVTVGERPIDGVPVLQGVVDAPPVWLTVGRGGGALSMRGVVAFLAVGWVGYELVRAVLARVRARSAEVARDALLQRLSHELRTPAAAVRSLAEALRSGAAVGQEAMFLARIEQEATRLASGIDGVLRAARGEATTQPLALQEVELRGLVERLVDRWGPRLGAIRVDGAGDCVVRLDPGRVEEALEALLDNAVIHGAPPVRVSVDTDGDFATVTIEDAGPGIPEADRARVLRRGEGRHTGIGLWAADEVARAHRGRLQLGDGSRVVLSLPRGMIRR